MVVAAGAGSIVFVGLGDGLGVALDAFMTAVVVACAPMAVCVLALIGADVGAGKWDNVDVAAKVGFGLIMLENKLRKEAGALSGLLIIQNAPTASIARTATNAAQASDDVFRGLGRAVGVLPKTGCGALSGDWSSALALG